MNSEEETGEIATRKALRQVSKHEKEDRFLTKRSEDFQVFEEVFDKPTLMVLYSMMNSGIFAHLNGVVGAGKESRVYWGVNNEGKDVAVKIYLMVSVDFKKRMVYIAGDPRFRNAKGWSHRLVEIWAQKEFKNLKAAFESGVRVPKPIAVRRNVLVTEFIGEKGKTPPLLSETTVTKSDYKKIIAMVKKLYRKAKLVHADLSEFNIFKGRELVIFDMGSSVDVRHPLNQQFLIRDLTNVNRFFSKNKIPIVPLDELVREIVGDELSPVSSSVI
ncbi:MAG TPA: serine protein kinase RIO [Nitrososphaerales archaeon]